MRPLAVVLPMLLFAAPVLAQTARPAPAVELTAGYAGFVDDATIDHSLFGGALRFHLTPRISIGPEVQYMIGPGDDRDLIVTGNFIFDFLTPDASGRRSTPYVVAGGGWFHNTMRVRTGLYSSGDPSFTAGGGYRAWIGDRVYIAPEFRFGWELHCRISGTVGIALR